MYLLYRILTALGMLLIGPYYAWRGWRRGEPASTLWERFGGVPPAIADRAKANPNCVWIHAVSVGEVLAAQPMVERLKACSAAPFLFPRPPKRASDWRARGCHPQMAFSTFRSIGWCRCAVPCVQFVPRW